MYSKLGTVVAVALAIFPFAAVVGKLFGSESPTTALIVAGICALFFITLLIASRVTIMPEAEPEPAPGPPRAPAPPVEWSWDGVNRQPDAEEQSKQDQGVSH